MFVCHYFRKYYNIQLQSVVDRAEVGQSRIELYSSVRPCVRVRKGLQTLYTIAAFQLR